MTESRGCLRLFLWGLLGLVVCVVVLVGWMRYSELSVQRQTRAFCDATPIGSNITAAMARAKAINVGWVLDHGTYTFVFPAGFDGAFCDLAVDGQGRVTSRKAEFYAD